MGQSQCLGGIQAGKSNAAENSGAAENITPPRKIGIRKLKNATNNFSVDHRIGEGDSSIVYRGTIGHKVVAIKRMKKTPGMDDLYSVEVSMLKSLIHPNIIDLIGFYWHDAEKYSLTECIIVYEYMPLRTLHDQLHARRPGEGVMDWGTRMRIGLGVAKGLSYIHNEAAPPVVYRDLKSTDVLLGNEYHPKISDFAVAINVSSRGQTSAQTGRPTEATRETNPHWAPEEAISHKADVYSFGVMLLEMLTRNKKIPDTAPDQVLAPANFVGMADSELNGHFPDGEFIKAMSLAMLCMREDPTVRPEMSDVVLGMKNLAGELNAEWPVEFNATERNEELHSAQTASLTESQSEIVIEPTESQDEIVIDPSKTFGEITEIG